jgi:hypothetical protein
LNAAWWWEEDLPCFVMWYDFYPMSCAFSIPEPWRGDRKHELDKNHITSQSTGDSFYHIFTTPYLLFVYFTLRMYGVGIHNEISKNYQMSDTYITLISRKICDKDIYL